MPETARNRNRVWITLFALFVACGALYLYLRNARDVTAIRTARVERTPLIYYNSTNGRVEALSDFQPRAPMASEVESMPLHLGEHVVRGQQLIRLDPSDAQSKIAAAEASLTSASGSLRNMEAGGTQDELLSERADLAAAQSQAQDATHALQALQALQAKGAASANEVASAQQKVADGEAKVRQLETRLHDRYSGSDLATQRAQRNEAQAQLRAAQSEYAGMDVRSPIDGTVYDLPYRQYDFVPANDPLLSIADLNRLQVRAYFDEDEIGSLAPGQPATISWNAKPNQVWHGHVTQIPATITVYNGTRNVGTCLISIDDAHGDLLPNTTVTVRVVTSEHLDVLSVPREALHTEGSSSFVYKVVGGKLVKTPVVVRSGDVNLTRAGIRGGLDQGDVVALSATTDVDLADGMHVKAER